MKIVVCTPDQFKSKQGIHLNCPDVYYYLDALQVAERDMFETIYLHYEEVGPSNYKIPYDVLNLIVAGIKEGEILVQFTHPARQDRGAL